MSHNPNIEEENQGIFSLSHVDSIEADKCQFNTKALPLLPTRNLVLFPFVHIPLSLVRAESLTTAKMVEGTTDCVGVICQRDPAVEHPTLNDLSEYGVIAKVLKVIELPNGQSTALILAFERFKLEGPAAEQDDRGFPLLAKVRRGGERFPAKDDEEFNITAGLISEQAMKIISSNQEIPDEMKAVVKQADNPVQLVNIIASQFPFPTEEKMELLAKGSLKQRARDLLSILQTSHERLEITKSILDRTRQAMNEQQRNAFLQHQLDTLKEELYGDSDDAKRLESRAAEAGFPDYVAETFKKELDKLSRTPQQSPDYSVSLNYLETLLDLPWKKASELNTDFSKAEAVLDEDHYGLEKVKDRILEQIAVLINNPGGHAPILCLVGPPGVGKTSLGRSVAKSLGLEYQRVSLGGLHDEAEIRGHRRTYIGAMPGRIISAMKQAGTVNPVLMLDEVDKIGADFKGDPAAALLEVLDPEQNCRFHDNFIDVNYDLSKVLFIATANSLQTIADPLLDRMEIIEISGYILEEKIKIARLHLLPRLLKEYNVDEADVNISDDALEAIIERYTAESGVRQLEKRLSSIVRKIILRKVSGKTPLEAITPDNLKEYLGVALYQRDRYEGNDFAGVVTGLAWTKVGGEILYVESSLSEGKGEKLSLTGNLGNVMKESASIALQYVKAHADVLGIAPEMFEKYQLHIHVPEGAIPKDGPSAGITMATSIISAFTRKKVRERTAMTGEITLRGKVLPVGGIKEKLLAAKRAGITDIILSEDNRKDVEDISEIYLRGVRFHYVRTVIDVVKLAITNEEATI